MTEDRKSLDEMLTILSSAPDSQIDKSVTKRLKSLVGKSIPEIKTEVMHCIDDCVNGSLASGFALNGLHLLFEIHLGGKPEDFNEENCPWRKL